MKVISTAKIDALLNMFCTAFGESKDILMTNRTGGCKRREPAGEEGGEGGTVYLGLEQI